MFEKEAEEYIKANNLEWALECHRTSPIGEVKQAYLAGAEFGYNKAKEEGKVVVEHFEAYGQCRDSRRIAGLEKENAELKERNIKFQKILTEDFIKDVSVSMEYADKLEQAKGLIRQLCLMVRELNNPNVQLTNVDYSLKEAEQFLKECENE